MKTIEEQAQESTSNDSVESAERVAAGWPDRFFDNSRFSPEDLAALRRAGDEMEREIEAARTIRSFAGF